MINIWFFTKKNQIEKRYKQVVKLNLSGFTLAGYIT